MDRNGDRFSAKPTSAPFAVDALIRWARIGAVSEVVGRTRQVVPTSGMAPHVLLRWTRCGRAGTVLLEPNRNPPG